MNDLPIACRMPLSEPQAVECLGVTLPVLDYFDPQIKVDRGTHQMGDPQAGLGPDLLE